MDLKLSHGDKDAPFFGVEEPRGQIAMVHLRQLHLGQITSHSTKPPKDKEESEAQACGLFVKLLKHWSDEHQDVINAAKTQRMNGPDKSSINWQNTFLAFMESTAMYLRDWGKLVKAVEKYEQFLKEHDATGLNEELRDHSIDLWEGSQADIREIAQYWGMDFVQICDLTKTGSDGHPEWNGPYCGAFYCSDKKNQFIGVAFKGTDPRNDGDIAVDYAYELQKADVSQLFGSTVSVGVYNGLFGTFSSDSDIPVVLISVMLDMEVVPKLVGAEKDVMTHVTGHSLGASYSSFCYAQFLVNQDSHVAPSKVIIGDQYNFGSPRVGAQDWAKALYARMESQVNGNIWRIVNAGDLIPQVPPACFKDIKGHRHIDNGIQISKDVDPVPMDSERIIDDPNFPPCKDIPRDRQELWKLILETGKHLPTSYYDALEKALGE